MPQVGPPESRHSSDVRHERQPQAGAACRRMSASMRTCLSSPLCWWL